MKYTRDEVSNMLIFPMIIEMKMQDFWTIFNREFKSEESTYETRIYDSEMQTLIGKVLEIQSHLQYNWPNH